MIPLPWRAVVTGRHRSSDGDDQFNAVCGLLYPEVLAAVEKELAPAMRTRLDATDIVQTTFREIVTLADRFRDDPRRLRRVLFGKARRKILSLGRYHRAKKRAMTREVPFSELDKDDSDALHPVDHAPSPADAVIHQELVLMLNDALGRLPTGEREVLELLLERCEYPEIAQRLSRSTETVRRTYWRAIEHLRDRMRSLRDDAGQASAAGTELDSAPV